MTSEILSYCSTGSNGNNLPDNTAQSLQNALQEYKSGRASTFTPEKGIKLLTGLIEGLTVQQACEDVGVSRATFYVWRSVVPGFLDMIREAQELQADSMVDDNVQLLESVDVTSEDIDPRRLMATLRKAEQVARFKFDLAKCLNNKYIEKKQNMNLNVNTTIKEGDASKWFNG